MHHNPPHLTPSRQRGMVLIIALIILAVLTILGVAGMSSSSLQERMAANEHDRQIAFQTAEAALRAGEYWIQSNAMTPGLFSTSCANGLCDCSDKTTGCVQYWTDSTLKVWASHSTPTHVTVPTVFKQVAIQPMYIIEYLGRINSVGEIPGSTPTSSDPMMFRITAVGYGQSPNAKVMLQSTYKKN